MKLTPASRDALKPFQKWNDHFIVLPPNRFIVFGEGKDASLRSIVAQGFLKQTVEEAGVYLFASLNKDECEKKAAGFRPERKVGFLDDLSEGNVVAEFFLSANQQKTLRKADARTYTHIRFFRKSGMPLRARIFDARKYFADAISDVSVDDYIEYELKAGDGVPFYFYIELSVFKSLLVDDYRIEVLDNEIIILEAVDSGVSFMTRDQRLGQKLETRLASLEDTDEVRFVDPSRMTPSKSDWNAPKVQRK